MENTQQTKTNKELSLILVLITWSIAFLLNYSKTSLNSYGCISCLDAPALVADVIIQTLTGIVILPLFHIGIASFWASKRTKKTRKNIFFGWSIFVIIGSTFQLMGIIA